MEIFSGLFLILFLMAASTLLPIIFGFGILYIIWCMLKKKEWV